jgi:hypothetical protein
MEAAVGIAVADGTAVAGGSVAMATGVELSVGLQAASRGTIKSPKINLRNIPFS